MTGFERRDGQLHAEGLACDELAARYGTPLFVYSRALIEERWRAFAEAFAEVPHRLCFACKANGNLALLGLLGELGAGFDVVSIGEAERARRAAGSGAHLVFSGVGKSAAELERGLGIGIGCFNVESVAELKRLSQIASAGGATARVAVRVNPGVKTSTHPYLRTASGDAKFGISPPAALEAYRLAHELPGVEPRGLACHLGSQLFDAAPYSAMLQQLLAMVAELRSQGLAVHHLDLGGGYGVSDGERPDFDLPVWGRQLAAAIAGQQLDIEIEPGRSLVAEAGLLLTRIEYLKQPPETGEDGKNFAVVDAAMNDFLRPSLYGAAHEIEAVRPSRAAEKLWDLVGPVCESGDFLGRDRQLALAAGDLLALRQAGAYGFALSSNYNARPRAAEVLVDGDRAALVREREPIERLYAGEALWQGLFEGD